MEIEALRAAAAKVVGLKQTSKAVKNGRAAAVFIAPDAEERLTAPLLEECERLGLMVDRTVPMADLGRACGIHAGAAAAAVLKD